MNEIYDEKIQKIETMTDHYEYCFDDGVGCDPKEFEDDGHIHICVDKYHFVFYNGQGKKMFTEKDVPKFTKIVNKVILK